MSLLGELNYFLSLQIIQSNKGIFIHQTKYVKDILRKFHFEYWKAVSTPMTVGCNLSKEDESKNVDKKSDRSIIGSCYMLQPPGQTSSKLLGWLLDSNQHQKRVMFNQ